MIPIPYLDMLPLITAFGVGLAVLLSVVALLRLPSRQIKHLAARLETLEILQDRLERALREELAHSRSETATLALEQRRELVSIIRNMGADLLHRHEDVGAAQAAQLDALRSQNMAMAKDQREEILTTLARMSETMSTTMKDLATVEKTQLEAMTTSLGQLTQSNAARLEQVRQTVDERLLAVQKDTARQLEAMRQIVDEKLQGTLEKRLGESFRQVSERLEQVHKGLGEMQRLATGVGDLKKVLSNVKTRGTWGEVQLGALLEQVLTTEQFVTNVALGAAGQRVEFAIKLPGQGKDEPVLLPMDAKFPVEDYQRLLEAQEHGDAPAAEAAGRQLEARVRACARDICAKYIHPPRTTDFALLFLPIEGLFAEVIRRPGLSEAIQRDLRVVIAGPTTLWSILTSLQMGFRTLAIQKRSSEVWALLGAVKTEWGKYGEVLDAVQKKLHQASSTIEQAQIRTRAVGRKLKNVQELPLAETRALLSADLAEKPDPGPREGQP